MEEAINEYLFTIKACIEYRKSDGGCLGYPAALLMLCTIEALGHFLRNELVEIDDTKQAITSGEPFRVLNHPFFDQKLSGEQINAIKDAYRNRLAHNAMIGPNAFLVLGETKSLFIFGGETVGIVVNELAKVLFAVWENFEKGLIRRAVERGYFSAPPRRKLRVAPAVP